MLYLLWSLNVKPFYVCYWRITSPRPGGCTSQPGSGKAGLPILWLSLSHQEDHWHRWWRSPWRSVLPLARPRQRWLRGKGEVWGLIWSGATPSQGRAVEGVPDTWSGSREAARTGATRSRLATLATVKGAEIISFSLESLWIKLKTGCTMEKVRELCSPGPSNTEMTSWATTAAVGNPRALRCGTMVASLALLPARTSPSGWWAPSGTAWAVRLTRLWGWSRQSY